MTVGLLQSACAQCSLTECKPTFTETKVPVTSNSVTAAGFADTTRELPSPSLQEHDGKAFASPLVKAFSLITSSGKRL